MPNSTIVSEMPDIVKKYALYLRNIKGRSKNTVNEYCLDIRTLLRFIKLDRKLVNSKIEFDEITVNDIDTEFIKSITSIEIFEFMNFVTDDKNNIASTRQRKSSSIKGFFKFLTVHEKILDEDPTENLTPPKKKKSLPKFLSLDQSKQLLSIIQGPDKERDYCIITLFLNCGMRLSELTNININDIQRNNNTIRIVGKGNKERIIYLNEACIKAIDDYLIIRNSKPSKDNKALFISNRSQRISPKTVQFLVKKYLAAIGLGGNGYSVHKLRHTAATLMYQYGNVDIRILQDILGHENLGTTEIYTHTSSKQIKDAIDSNPLAGIDPDSKKNETS
jgi:site-specific recombinase XerD